MTKGDKRRQVRARKADWSKSIEVAIFDEVVGVSLHVVTDLTFEEADESCYIPSCLRLDNTTAQQLMDDLWTCGIRPTEGMGSAGSMTAVQNHLKDMQRLVFKGKNG